MTRSERRNAMLKTVLCPSCLHMVEPRLDIEELEMRTPAEKYACPSCNESLPDPNRFAIHDPREVIILSGIGMDRHGKTVYMASLFYAFEILLHKYSNNYYSFKANDPRINRVGSAIESLFTRKEMPAPTDLDFPKPTVVFHYNLYGHSRLASIFYDVGGEVFKAENTIRRNVHYMAHAQSAIFIIALPEVIPSTPGKSSPDDILRLRVFNDLLQRYSNAMGSLSDLSQQQLIVVYTKADAVLGRLPSVLRDYLVSGMNSLPTQAELPTYYKQMDYISQLLEHFTLKRLQAEQFINLAKNTFGRVRFSIVSALGSIPINGRMTQDVSPRRVLDPFLWAMDTPGTQDMLKKRKRFILF